MKKLRSIVMVIVCALFLVLSTGCGDKTPMKAADFKAKMEKKGFNITDVKEEQFDEYETIETALVAVSKNGKYQIEFYVMSDDDYASKFYNNNRKLFEEESSKAKTKVSSSFGNTEKISINANGKYKVVSRIGNTVIYINAVEKYKSEIKDILDEFDY